MHIIVIGGGFYGVNVALCLRTLYPLANISIIERSKKLLTRASYNNQARIHNGYHYPRSYTTAYRSRINLPKFVQQWNDAVFKNFKNIYAIARNGSKVNSVQFERFCRSIGAKCERIDVDFFNNKLISSAYLTEEFVFDSSIINDIAIDLLNAESILTIYSTNVDEVLSKDNRFSVITTSGNESNEYHADLIFNCTYSGIGSTGIDIKTGIKHEITEMALVEVPSLLKNYGITVMDGPYFSLMPFPSRKLHTLSHVRYTPHFSWLERKSINPYKVLDDYNKVSRFELMKRDASRYIESLKDCVRIDSLFEVKTLLVSNETDDGRPILFERNHYHQNIYSILGGKIDNIYDALSQIRNKIST